MKKLYTALGVLQVFVAIGAIPAAAMFLIKPDGSLLGMNTYLLENSPFQDFLIPGLFLLIFIGFGNLFASFFAFKKSITAGRYGIINGIILLTWILIQVYWVGYISFLQPLMASVGIVQIILGLMIIKKN